MVTAEALEKKRRIIHVVAGTYEEYRELHKRKEKEYLDKQYEQTEVFPKYSYVATVDQLKGLDKIEGFYYGSYEQRYNINELRQIIEIIKRRMKESSETI
jgi:hypothetical protein